MRHIEIPTSAKPITGDDFGAPPSLEWIEIRNLVIDDSYQRDLKTDSWRAIRRIAAAFKWSQFSPVFVSPVDGGLFAIIDGQHRVHAALLRGIDSVPCQIVRMTLPEQARAFAAVNGQVTKVTTWQVYKAAFAAGEDWAVKSAAVCEAAGCRLMTSNASTATKRPGEVYAVGLIRAAVAAGRGESVTVTLRAIKMSSFGADAEAYSGEVLRAFVAAISERPWLHQISPMALGTCIDEMDFYAIADRAAAQAKEMRRSGERMSQSDLVAADVGALFDRRFPQRIRMPEAAA